MDASKILGADILDILFDGRNKEYGAYELRMTYPRRLLTAMGSMVAILLLLLLGYYVAGMHKTRRPQAQAINDVELVQIPDDKKTEVLPPPSPRTEPQRVRMAAFTPPRLVNEEVKPDEKPPEQDQLVDTKIGNVNQDGVAYDGVTGPPSDVAGKGLVEAPKKAEEDIIFNKVEIESSYPGGTPAWQRFLNKNLRIPDAAVDAGIDGTVVIQFIVDKEGNVSDVQAVSGPEQLAQAAITVIKKSGKWTSAIQNGRQVKSYKRQPIIFKIDQ